MDGLCETELVKNCLIPVSDGVTLAADLYRPRVDYPVPALLSFYPYRKDDRHGPGRAEGSFRALAQAGYGCLLVDVRGTGNSGGHTVFYHTRRDRRDYAEAVEWAARQSWCDGKVGVWGISFGSVAALLAAAEGPPHLGAVAAFHGARDESDDVLFPGNRMDFLPWVPNWGALMAAMNFMVPGYRDPDGRWLSVWLEHLESNVPWLVTGLDRVTSGQLEVEPPTATLGRIQAPTYLWAGWHDLYPKHMVEAYQMLQGPKKLTVGPWVHALPDEGDTARVDYLHELQRWFDYWLRGRDTGIMDEQPVSIWIQEADRWVYEEDFPPTDVQEHTFFLGPEARLSNREPGIVGGGTDSFDYDPTVGLGDDTWHALGGSGGYRASPDQRPDELKGLTYTTPPLDESLEICGAPEAVIRYASTARETLLVVKLCDVSPDGRSRLITSGWLDVTQPGEYPSTWGEVLELGSSARISLIPTSYLVRAGHALRVFISGSLFPRSIPSRYPGQISVDWGREPPSSIRVPVRSPRTKTRTPVFLTPREVARPPTSAPLWRIEQSPIDGTITVRIETSQTLGIDGGEAPATFAYTHRCSATTGQTQPDRTSANAVTQITWQSQYDSVEVRSTVLFRPNGLLVSVSIALNRVPYWHRSWSRHWPEQRWAI